MVGNPPEHRHKKGIRRKEADIGLTAVGILSLLWLILRTGRKPSRIAYPCQQVAAVNVCFLLHIPVLSVFAFSFKVEQKLGRLVTHKRVLAVALAILIVNSLYQEFEQIEVWAEPDGYGPFYLTLLPKNATMENASDIFVVNSKLGNDTGMTELVELMGAHGTLFYKTNETGGDRGPNGLIAKDDVVLIKINSQWDYRGGTNNDLLKGLIQKIVTHPSNFTGEIVVADNGQMYTQYKGWGYMDFGTRNNAEDHSFSVEDVVNSFPSYHISTYRWDGIKNITVSEYNEGNFTDGYVVPHETANPRTQINVTYPKFKTKYGTYVSFMMGIWNNETSAYEDRLKVINTQVLKSHGAYGATGCVKNYMGVQSQNSSNYPGLGNGHETVKYGSMGTLMVETRFPTLNILDAIYVNAHPVPSENHGPTTSYGQAAKVNVVAASRDPVALDYFGAKHVLMQTATLLNHTDTRSIDPDSAQKSFPPHGPLEEAFGVWLNKSRDEIRLGGHQATTNEEQMNIYVSTVNYELNLRIRDWDLESNIAGAYVYKNDALKVSNDNGWANWTDVSGVVQIRVMYFGKWVNGTFSVYVNTTMAIDVQCNIFDITVKCKEKPLGGYLENANVTVYNSTSTAGNMICTAKTDANGVARLDNVPNGTLTFTVYDVRPPPWFIANVTRTVVSEGQQETIVCDQNYVETLTKWEICTQIGG